MLTDKLIIVNQQLGPLTMGHRDRRKGLIVHEDSDAGTGPLQTGACPCLRSDVGAPRAAPEFLNLLLAAAEARSGRVMGRASSNSRSGEQWRCPESALLGLALGPWPYKRRPMWPAGDRSVWGYHWFAAQPQMLQPRFGQRE